MIINLGGVGKIVRPSQPEASYTYDANGNLVNEGQFSYTYDRANWLVLSEVEGLTQLSSGLLGIGVQRRQAADRPN
jgi:hypothetical protein